MIHGTALASTQLYHYQKDKNTDFNILNILGVVKKNWYVLAPD